MRAVRFHSLRHAWMTVLVLLPLLAVAAPVELALSIADLQREGVQARGIELALVHRGGDYDLRLKVASLRLPGLDAPLKGVELDCPGAPADWPALHCRKAVLKIAASPWGRQRLRLDLDSNGSDQWRARFSGLRLAGDRLSGRLSWRAGRWRLSARARALQLKRLPGLTAWRRKQGLDALDGRLAATLDLSGDAGGVRALKAKGRFGRLAWADSAGEQAAEKLAGRFEVEGRQSGGWRGSLDLRLEAGELYSDPVFLDLGKQPLHLRAGGRWRSPELDLTRLSLDAGQALRADAALVLDTGKKQVRSGRAHLESASLKDLHRQLLQPLLADGPLAELELEGRGSLDLRWADARLAALDAQVKGADLDRAAGLGANGLAADLHWRRDGRVAPSRLSLAGGHLGRLDFGAARADFVMSGPSAWLSRPLVIPFYEGKIRLDRLTWVQTAQGPDVGFSLDLEGVQLEQLSTDLGWPRMRGALSSRVPRARYHDGSLRVDGDLLVRAFDGSLRLKRLRLDDLGSVAPVLRGEVELRGLDLLKLTQTFSFGEMQGRLDGEVRDLRLVAWRSDQFDAHLYTAPHDDLRHRISQRAVENLTELGNGVSGALSSSFLRFFEQFSYDRIELRIRQRGDTAWIDGIPAPDGGYYLVKGAGIPRIDVIGRNRKVGWDDLLARLRSIRFKGVKVR